MLAEAQANAILDALYGSGSPATLYIALYTSTPGPDGTGGTEVTGGSYARKAVTNNDTNWPDAVDGVKENGTPITFAAATADWGIIEGVGVHDHATAGNLHDFGDLETPRTVLNSDQFSFAAGQLIISYPQS